MVNAIEVVTVVLVSFSVSVMVSSLIIHWRDKDV